MTITIGFRKFWSLNYRVPATNERWSEKLGSHKIQVLQSVLGGIAFAKLTIIYTNDPPIICVIHLSTGVKMCFMGSYLHGMQRISRQGCKCSSEHILVDTSKSNTLNIKSYRQQCDLIELHSEIACFTRLTYFGHFPIECNCESDVANNWGSLYFYGTNVFASGDVKHQRNISLS